MVCVVKGEEPKPQQPPSEDLNTKRNNLWQFIAKKDIPKVETIGRLVSVYITITVIPIVVIIFITIIIIIIVIITIVSLSSSPSYVHMYCSVLLRLPEQ